MYVVIHHVKVFRVRSVCVMLCCYDQLTGFVIRESALWLEGRTQQKLFFIKLPHIIAKDPDPDEL